MVVVEPAAASAAVGVVRCWMLLFVAKKLIGHDYKYIIQRS